MNITGWKCAWAVVATTTACLALTLSLRAQVETKTTTAMGKDTVVTKVELGEVVTSVSGNDAWSSKWRMALSAILAPNVPDYARATVDGKQLESIHDLKSGI